MKLISWNIGARVKAWDQLWNANADVALLQEANEPPANVRDTVGVDEEPWVTDGLDPTVFSRRAAVVRLSSRVRVAWFRPLRFGEKDSHGFRVSRKGTIAAAKVAQDGIEPITVISIYGIWEKPHESTGSRWIYADASVHRLISDLSTFIGSQTHHRILAAGDLNIFNGYGDGGSKYWAARYATVFERMKAMGLPFVGPQAPNGRRADPRPVHLPSDCKNVPTFYTNKMTPATAENQLDFVFASESLAPYVTVRAINEPDGWGPSDHCRVEIEIS